MKLTLIIATYNRSASLIRPLESVARQSAAPELWECVVVNNNSKDDTESAFATFAEAHKQLNLRMVREEEQGLSAARNRGIREAQGSYVAIIDDDETISKHFIEAYIELFDGGDAFAACGPIEACYESKRPLWMSTFTEKMIANPLDLGKKLCNVPLDVMPGGGNMAFRREVFDMYGFFDTQLGRNGENLTGGEECDIYSRIRQIGERIFYVPQSKVYHHIPDTKLTRDYFDRLSYAVGHSKRLRAEKSGSLYHLYDDERSKVFYTYILAALYSLVLCPHKAVWLLRMRKGISRGVFDK